MAHIVLIRSNPVNPDPPVEKVANTLLKAGYQVTVLGWDRASAYKQSEDVMVCPDGTAKIIRFGILAEFSAGFKKNALPLAKFQINLGKWLCKHHAEYDAIHAFDFDAGLTAYYCSRLYRKKMVYHILDYYVESHKFSEGFLKRKVEQFERMVINGADAAIICTEKRKVQIEGTTPKRLVVVHNTPDQIAFDASDYRDATSSCRCKIVYVGILAGLRLLDELVKTVDEDDRFELHIGGFGELEEFVKGIAEKNDRVKFYGKLPYTKALALESCCDLMVAIYDPIRRNHRCAAPNKFYESLMLGKPIVMAQDTGFDDVIETNNIGCLIEYSKEGLLKGLEQLLDQKKTWADMGFRSQQLYRDEFSWNIMERRIIGLYQEFLLDK